MANRWNLISMIGMAVCLPLIAAGCCTNAGNQSSSIANPAPRPFEITGKRINLKPGEFSFPKLKQELPEGYSIQRFREECKKWHFTCSTPAYLNLRLNKSHPEKTEPKIHDIWSKNPASHYEVLVKHWSDRQTRKFNNFSQARIVDNLSWNYATVEKREGAAWHISDGMGLNGTWFSPFSQEPLAPTATSYVNTVNLEIGEKVELARISRKDSGVTLSLSVMFTESLPQDNTLPGADGSLEQQH